MKREFEKNLFYEQLNGFAAVEEKNSDYNENKKFAVKLTLTVLLSHSNYLESEGDFKPYFRTQERLKEFIK